MDDLLEIEGSAGGQILRTSLALSSLLNKPVRVFNIRASRPKPGLQPQHLAALKTLQELAKAEVKGAGIGSMEIIFRPSGIRQESLNVNIGTAGSITLLLQAAMLPSIIEDIKLHIRGGTDVSWSPPFNYMKEVLLPALSRMGAKYELSLQRRGYYPKGGGLVLFRSARREEPLKSINSTSRGKIKFIKIFSHSASLPKEVSLNQAASAKKFLGSLDADFEENMEWKEKSSTIGSGIDLIACFSSGNAIGASALGAKGKPAAAVGREAAEKLICEINSGAPVDSHLADQLIPFMALAEGKSEIACSKITEHCLNNIKVTEKFLGVKFEVSENEGRISVNGAGFKSSIP